MDQNITVTFVIHREDDQFVSFCPEFEVASCGDTVEDAARHLEDAVLAYLDVIERDGEQERIFGLRGITPTQRIEATYKVTVPSGVFATVKQMPVGVG